MLLNSPKRAKNTFKRKKYQKVLKKLLTSKSQENVAKYSKKGKKHFKAQKIPKSAKKVANFKNLKKVKRMLLNNQKTTKNTLKRKKNQ